MEELLEHHLLALEELDVIEEEDVDLPVPRFEVVHLLAADRVDEVVEEGLGGCVLHDGVAGQLEAMLPHGMEEVRLAEPGTRVDEQRVVVAARFLGDRLGRGVGKAIRRTDDEIVERVASEEVRRVALCEWFVDPRPCVIIEGRLIRSLVLLLLHLGSIRHRDGDLERLRPDR